MDARLASMDADYTPNDVGPPDGNHYEPVDQEAEMERLAEIDLDTQL